MEQSFRNICKCIAMSCSLTILLPEDNFSLVIDSSGRGIGGALQVRRDGEWVAAAYYSRQTRGAERRYSTTELEALAVVESILHFSYYLYGKEFEVMTEQTLV